MAFSLVRSYFRLRRSKSQAPPDWYNIIKNKTKYNQKLTDEQKEIIKDFKEKHKSDIEKETRTYFCKIHKRFHKHLYKDKISQTYIKCLKSGNMLRFKDDYTNTELFKMDLSKKWNQKNANYYKKVK